jgi:hypothetical protein
VGTFEGCFGAKRGCIWGFLRGDLESRFGSELMGF